MKLHQIIKLKEKVLKVAMVILSMDLLMNQSNILRKTIQFLIKINRKSSDMIREEETAEDIDFVKHEGNRKEYHKILP